LVKFNNKNGHCNIPQTGSRLATWVGTQRTSSREGKLSIERVTRLEMLGFTLDTNKALWEKMLTEMSYFKNKNGHCNIAQRDSDNPKLASWVSNQRENNKKRNLSIEQVNSLDEIGFIWNVLDYQWEQSFVELIKFKKKNGHCNIPRCYSESPKLGLWLSSQRISKKNGRLSPERINKLDSIDFVWEMS